MASGMAWEGPIKPQLNKEVKGNAQHSFYINYFRLIPAGSSLFHGSVIFVRFLALPPSSVGKMKEMVAPSQMCWANEEFESPVGKK